MNRSTTELFRRLSEAAQKFALHDFHNCERGCGLTTPGYCLEAAELLAQHTEEDIRLRLEMQPNLSAQDVRRQVEEAKRLMTARKDQE